MRALIFDGSEPGLADLSILRRVLVDQLEQAGWLVNERILRLMEITPCCGTFSCWVRTPGECALGDTCRQIGEDAATHDLLVFLTPIVFGGYSYSLKKAVDHLIPNISPYMTSIAGESRHKRRYDRYPALLAVGYQRQPNPETRRLFERLVERNALNLYPPSTVCLVFNGEQDLDEQRAQVAAGLTRLGARA